MNKQYYQLLGAFAVGIALSITASIGFAEQLADAAPQETVIVRPAGYDAIAGAAAYQGAGNVEHSPYYAAPDIFNMTSTATRTILPHYKTYQQTTEITCGPAAAMTVVHHFGYTEWEEYKIAGMMGTKPNIGTDTAGMVKFFQDIGWQVESSLDQAGKDGLSFANVDTFKAFVVERLQQNTPIMVENIDWGGHWRVIIGYDDMGTATTADDVLIMADSYDTADHWQDGYVIVPVEKFYYMWFDAHMLPKAHQKQQWLTARPPLS